MRKPPNADPAPAPVEPAESSAASSSAASPAPSKARPRPVPRPGPLTSSAPSAAETTQEIRLPGGISRAKPVAEPEPVEAVDEAPAEVDPLTGEEVNEDPSDAADSDTTGADAPARPRRKRRDEGTAKPVDLDEAESSGEESTSFAAPRPDRRIGQTLTIGLVIVGLVLAGLAVFFKLQYDTAAGATSNTALLDVAKTAQVKDQVSQATESLFSYDFNNIKKTEDAAGNLLANNDVKAKYNSLMGEVKRLAPQQKMVVTCKVTRSAVIMLDGDRARVMVFVDQTSTRADTKQTTAGSAQLHVDAQLEGNTWKITDLDTYKAPPAPSGQAPASSAPASPPPSK
jgi:Mce-associated membrane protein